MELQDRLEELQSAGIGVAAISYDSEDTLFKFAERRGITFPLLSDDDSVVITDFGILNTIVAQGLGARADDPDVTLCRLSMMDYTSDIANAHVILLYALLDGQYSWQSI